MSAPLSEQQLAEIRAALARVEPATGEQVRATVSDALSVIGHNHQPLIMERLRRAEGTVPAIVRRLLDAEAEVERLRLSPHERLILKFALEMADDAIASNPADFTDEDQAAMDKLRAMATGEVVAYRNPWRPGVLLCREHGEGWAGLKPLAAEDLPDGGTCTYGDPADPADVCGRDVLIGAGTEGGAS